MSTSLNLLGATLISTSTTSLADFSNFAKVKVAASSADDAVARNDYVNTKISQSSGNITSILKLSSSTQTISSGVITVNKSYEKLIVNGSDNILSKINSVDTLEDGMIIVLQANAPSSTITVNTNKNIRLNNDVACSLTGYNTLQLIYSSVSNSWIELSRTIIAAIASPTLSLSNINKFVTDASFSLTSLVSTNSTGVLSFSLSGPSSVATINGDVVTIVGAGTTNISVSIDGTNDGKYYAATTTATLSVTSIQKAVISFLQGSTVTLTQLGYYALSAYFESSNSSQPLNYSYDPQPYLEIQNMPMGGYIMLPMSNGGPVVITVSQNGDDNYLAPDPVTLEVLVNL